MSTVEETGVRSKRTAQFTGLTILDRVVHLIKQAGAPTEAQTERDGFLSYKSETHAAGAGIGIGFAIGASGELSFLGAILTFVIYGNRGEGFLSPVLVYDIRKEMQYFLGSLVIGLILGVAARLLLGLGVPFSNILTGVM